MHSQAIISALGASVSGRGDQVLVLANGLGTSQQAWRDVAAAFEGCCRVVRFDYVGTPGTGEQAARPQRYDTLHGHVDDVISLLDTLGLSDVTWVGHSVSGIIGLLAAAAAPSLIGRAVLVAASPRYIDDAGYVGGFSGADIDGLLAAVASDYHAWVGGFSPLVVGRTDFPAVVEEFAGRLRGMRPDVAIQTLRSIFLSDHRRVLPQLDLPVMVLQPEADAAVPPEVGRYLASSLPRAELRQLRARGHLPHLTARDEFIAVLRQVLSDWGVAAGDDLTGGGALTDDGHGASGHGASAA